MTLFEALTKYRHLLPDVLVIHYKDHIYEVDTDQLKDKKDNDLIDEKAHYYYHSLFESKIIKAVDKTKKMEVWLRGRFEKC